MNESYIKEVTKNYITQACCSLDYTVVSIYSTNYFILMDNETKRMHVFSLDLLEKELSDRRVRLKLDYLEREEAIRGNYFYA